MRNFNRLFSFRLILVFVVVSLFFSSCKEDEVDPDYFGTWEMTQSVDQGGVSMNMKHSITLTKDLYSTIVSTQMPMLPVWLEFAKANGTYSVNGSKVTITYTEISVKDETLNWVTYKSGSADFNTQLAVLPLNAIDAFDFSVSGDKLTLKQDFNKDGDFADLGETLVYTRK